MRRRLDVDVAPSVSEADCSALTGECAPRNLSTRPSGRRGTDVIVCVALPSGVAVPLPLPCIRVWREIFVGAMRRGGRTGEEDIMSVWLDCILCHGSGSVLNQPRFVTICDSDSLWHKKIPEAFGATFSIIQAEYTVILTTT